MVLTKGKRTSRFALWLIWPLKSKQERKQRHEEEGAVRLESRGAAAAAVLDCSRAWRGKKEAGVLPKSYTVRTVFGACLLHMNIFMWGGGGKAIKTRNTCWRSGRKNIWSCRQVLHI